MHSIVTEGGDSVNCGIASYDVDSVRLDATSFDKYKVPLTYIVMAQLILNLETKHSLEQTSNLYIRKAS